jgi:hypothetical protein
MKYIKTYEDIFSILSESEPNYKVDDTVICVYKYSDHIKEGEKYTVKNIRLKKGKYYVKLKESDAQYYSSKFVSAEEYYAKKYNL